MSQKNTRKTAHYLRSIFGDQAVDLESLVSAARAIFGTVAASEIALGGGDIVRIQHYRSNSTGVFLHLARYIPGERASTLLPKAGLPEDDEGAQSAPSGMEFKDGDSYLLINRHNVVFCSHGISVEKSRLYLSMLFDKAGIDKLKRSFELRPATNIDKIRLLHRHGVKSIELGTTAYNISLPQEKPDGWVNKVFSGVANELKALIAKDESSEELKLFEDLLVNVELRLDGNTRAAAVTQGFIEHVASSLLDDQEESVISQFTITTRNNDKITSAQTRLQENFNVAQENGSISHFGVWDGLGKYLEAITQGNLVEQ